jgi:hypothetical protein
MKRPLKVVTLLLIFFISACESQKIPVPLSPAFEVETAQLPIETSSPAPITAISLPPAGKFYHGIYPGGISGAESDLTLDDLRSYEETVGKTAVWVYFSQNWFDGLDFPLETADWIREAGSIPYIRMMPWSKWEQNVAEPLYHQQNILNGQFDDALHDWCASARDFGTALLVEYGTEVNGEWFPWNGKWNGGGETNGYGALDYPDGPERFRDAYRHFINICRQEGVENITWVFHVDVGGFPEDSWNNAENYYPGDEWIDWIGFSDYGALTPQDDYWENFRDRLDPAYEQVEVFAPDKPVVINEFGVPNYNPLGDQAEWARAALTEIFSMRWERVIGFSWWNEWWQNDDNPAHDTTMRVQDNPALADVFKELIGDNEAVLGRLAPK